jgi:SAM-dependent methyltransferase
MLWDLQMEAGMAGHIDILDSQQVAGWALEADGKTPDRVIIYVNGREIAQVRPTLFRADVRDAGLGDGWSGFRFYFPEPIEICDPSNVVVRSASSGEIIPHIPSRLSGMSSGQFTLNEDFVRTVYKSILHREPDADSFSHFVNGLNFGNISQSEVIKAVAGSPDNWVVASHNIFGKHNLPNLASKYSCRYASIPRAAGQGDIKVFVVDEDSDFDWIENHIYSDGYYEAIGEWILIPHEAFSIIANQICDLGGKSVLEIGCSSGHVIKSLLDRGKDANGVEVSHLSMALAAFEVRSRIYFGDLISLNINKKYDIIVGMDVFEHLNPMKIDRYIERCNQLLNPHGILYINSPMFGQDRNFGEIFSFYIEAWYDSRDGLFRQIEVDERGWPRGGHLIWARPDWWEAQFRRHGMLRDEHAETMLHSKYASYFAQAPARKSLMVLRKQS